MARIVVVCPSCNSKVETPEENIGRDGQCPKCETVFGITEPRRPLAEGTGLAIEPGEGWLAGAPAEYGDALALSGAVAVGICLLLLIASTFTRWVSPHGPAAAFVPGERLIIVAVSVACWIFVAASAILRKSLAPAALVAGAWGALAAGWIIGMLRSLETIVETAKGQDFGESAVVRLGLTFSPTRGIYFGIVAALLLIAASGYACYQYRNVKAVRGFGLFLTVGVVLGFVAGVFVVSRHVKPSLNHLLELPAEQSQQETGEARLFEPGPLGLPPFANPPA